MIKLNNRNFLYVLACSLCLWACGDDGESAPDAAATPDAAADSDGAPAGSTAFIVAGDFTSGTGVASTISIPGLDVTSNAIAGVASDDPVLRLYDGTLYIINRFNHDNITMVDAAAGTLIEQIGTGAGSNPQDVAVKGTTLYVAALNAAGVLVIDTANPGTPMTIDLSSLDPNDNVPDCNSVSLVGDLLFVTCGILNNFVPSGLGKVAVIDTTDNSVQTTFDLTTENPVGFLRQTPPDSRLGGDLLVSTVTFGADLNTGCLERISTGKTPASGGCLVPNADMGGYATGYVYGPDDTLYIAVTQAFEAEGTAAQVFTYDAATSMLDTTPVNGAGQRVFDIAQCPTGEWLFADDTGGIRVYGADGVELTTDVLDIGLPPVGNAMVCF